MSIKINNKEITPKKGETILSAAQELGIDIPTMCYLKPFPHNTTCMVCLVEDKKSGKLLPSCSTALQDGMDIETNSEKVHSARKDAIDLLLSDHVGDCEAPCQNLCPAHMNIPLMTRLIAKGDFSKALEVVKRDIALPAVLGYICPAPCEKGCRRASIDDPVSICMLKRFVGEEDIKQENPFAPKSTKKTGKKIAIIGAGPAGLATAYYLQLKGHSCEIFDKNVQAGGTLRYAKMDKELPTSVLDAEIKAITNIGVKIHLNKAIFQEDFNKLQVDFDALCICTGTLTEDNKWEALSYGKSGVETKAGLYITSIKGVFVAGNAIRDGKMAVRAVGQGKEMAFSVDQYLSNQKISGEKKRFNSKFGKLTPVEFSEYLKEANPRKRLENKSIASGYENTNAIAEAQRCMHCDCRKPNNCKLRDYAEEYSANQRTFQIEKRNAVVKNIHADYLLYEPEKCIKCGICIQICEDKQEDLGLSFIGRGFDVKIAVPFNKPIEEALKVAGGECAKNCPTGAISLLNNEIDE